MKRIHMLCLLVGLALAAPMGLQADDDVQQPRIVAYNYPDLRLYVSDGAGGYTRVEKLSGVALPPLPIPIEAMSSKQYYLIAVNGDLYWTPTSDVRVEPKDLPRYSKCVRKVPDPSTGYPELRQHFSSRGLGDDRCE